MRLDVFTELINSINSNNDKLHKIYQCGVDLYNVVDDYSHINTLLLNSYFGEEGADWIEWFCYEKFDSTPPLIATDENENEICYDIESLWKFVEELRNGPTFKEYELPTPLSDEELSKIFASWY